MKNLNQRITLTNELHRYIKEDKQKKNRYNKESEKTN